MSYGYYGWGYKFSKYGWSNKHNWSKKWHRCDDRDYEWKGCGYKHKSWKKKKWCKPEEEENQAPTIINPADGQTNFDALVNPVNGSVSFMAIDFEATDPEDDTLVFTITGEDADAFSIEIDPNDPNSGQIVLSSPDALEGNGSADGDSDYEITLQVTDGTDGNVDTIDLVVDVFSGG